MPAALPRDRFVEFNQTYIAQMGAWGLLLDGAPTLARTNVIPVGDPVDEPGVLAFSYTVPDGRAVPSFVVSGAAEVPGGRDYPNGIARRGETSPDALVEKVATAVREVVRCTQALEVAWDPWTQVNLYSVYPAAAAAGYEQIAAVAGVVPAHGVTWHRTAPPVHLLEVEVDVRRYGAEIPLL
jgi:hypothetical protein